SLLEISDLHISFVSRHAEVAAVRGVDLRVEEGRTVALVGESGSGKSSIALSILRLNPEPPATYPQGQIAFEGPTYCNCGPNLCVRCAGGTSRWCSRTLWPR